MDNICIGVIYMTICLTDGMSYVGYHYTSADDGYLGSGKELSKQISKQHKNNFRRLILDHYSSKAERKNKERLWIKKLNMQNNKVGYNISKGGSDCLSDHPNKKFIYKKIADKLRGGVFSNEINMKKGRKGISRPEHSSLMKNNNPMSGKTHSKISIQKNRNSNCKFIYIIKSGELLFVENSLNWFCNKNGLSQSSFSGSINKNIPYKKWLGVKIPKDKFVDINIMELSIKYNINYKELKNEIEKYKEKNIAG